MPTWVHGLLQKLITQLLEEAGFLSTSEVELRTDPGAHPKPDVIATRSKFPSGSYPTEALDVVVEIIFEDDRYSIVRDKCRKYAEWGFGHIFLVDPSDRSVIEWKQGGGVLSPDLMGISSDRIWLELDGQHRP